MFYTDKIVFVHPPSSGGSSVSLSFGQVDGGKEFNGRNLGSHATASEIREAMGHEEFDKRWSFSVIRNPWKRMVSLFHMYGQPGKLLKHFGEEWESIYAEVQTFKGFMMNYPRTNLPETSGSFNSSQMHWARGVDRVFNMDNEPELNEEMAKRGYPEGITYDHFNQFNPHLPYQGYYDDELKEMVGEWCREDIEMCGFTF